MLFEEARVYFAEEEQRAAAELSKEELSAVRPLGAFSEAPASGQSGARGRGGRFSRGMPKPPSELVAEIDEERAALLAELRELGSVNPEADLAAEESAARATLKANLLRDFSQGTNPPTPKTVRFQPGF